MNIGIKLKSRIVFLAAICIALSALDAMSEDKESPLGSLDALVGRWMGLRTTIAEEKNEWNLREKQWQNEINLLEKESDSLKKEIDAGDSFVTSVDKKLASTQSRKELTEKELTKLNSVLGLAESDLRKWEKRIPAGLRMKMGVSFDAIPRTVEDSDKMLITKRAQTVVALYTQIESLQNQFHSIHETLNVNGVRRQVDVLYVGLARAFAVSAGNDWAAVGVPTDDGWTWITRSEEAGRIRQAINILDHQDTIRLVSLPMQIKQGGGDE